MDCCHELKCQSKSIVGVDTKYYGSLYGLHDQHILLDVCGDWRAMMIDIVLTFLDIYGNQTSLI